MHRLFPFFVAVLAAPSFVPHSHEKEKSTDVKRPVALREIGEASVRAGTSTPQIRVEAANFPQTLDLAQRGAEKSNDSTQR